MDKDWSEIYNKIINLEKRVKHLEETITVCEQYYYTELLKREEKNEHMPLEAVNMYNILQDKEYVKTRLFKK